MSLEDALKVSDGECMHQLGWTISKDLPAVKVVRRTLLGPGPKGKGKGKGKGKDAHEIIAIIDRANVAIETGAVEDGNAGVVSHDTAVDLEAAPAGPGSHATGKHFRTMRAT